MAALTSRQELINYCLRALGSPVIEVNVETTQLNDRVDEALSLYQEYHSDAIKKEFLKHQITALDMTNEYITVDSNLTSIVRILPLQTGSAGSLFNANYQIALNDVYNVRGGNVTGNMSSFYQTQQTMGLINGLFGTDAITRYQRHGNKLNIDVDWGVDISLGDYIVIEGVVIVDPEVYTEVYNDFFLKRYTIQLIKRQWGINLKKFEGMLLPGGVTFNGQILFDEATAEILALEEEIRLNWEEPVNLMIG